MPRIERIFDAQNRAISSFGAGVAVAEHRSAGGGADPEEEHKGSGLCEGPGTI